MRYPWLQSFRSLSFFPILALFPWASVCPAADLFTRITSDPIVSIGRATVAAWGDFNHDGFIDLVAGPNNVPTLLYSNNGNGTFTQVMTGPVVADSGTTFGCVWADYDNDGALDLFVSVNGGSRSDWLYRNNGNGTFTKITTGTIVTSGGAGNNSVWGDYDNDGFVDLFVANSDQNDFLYHNNGNGTFTRITNNAIALRPGNSQGASWGDYDNDGLLDLFVSRVNEPNLLYHNLGNGNFAAITSGLIVNEPTASQGVSWGDYDNDGFLDLFVASPNVRNFLYHNNGDGTFTKITNGAIANDIGNSHGCAWADYDNDGYIDMVVINRLGVNFLYHNNGEGTFTRVTGSEALITDAGEAFSGAWGDYNNDGFPDLFLAHFQNFNNALYRNNGNSNHWITITCEGRLSNRSAIGAKVRVKATINGKVLWQMRDISGGGGLGSQNDLRAGFGLGDATSAEVVRIEWPSGVVQQFTNVPAQQFLTIVEPSASISPASNFLPAGTNATFALQPDPGPTAQRQWSLNGVALAGETNATLNITNVQNANAGSYTVSVTDTAAGSSFTTRAATLAGPVVILQQPVFQNIRVGSNGAFSLIATGFPPLTIQWQRNGTNLAGATNSLLTLTNVQIADEDSYNAIISNSYDAQSSSNARLTALIKPVLTVHPLAQKVVAGGSVTLSASATGYPFPLTFRWFKNGSFFSAVTLADTNCFFTITNVQPPIPPSLLQYRVTVTNLAGSANGANVILTVLADTDGDGIPDEWEVAHSLDPNNPDDATLDNDADGATNLAEYRAGTDPNGALSKLNLELVTVGNSNALLLRFFAASNHAYCLEERGAVDVGAWSPVATFTASPTNRWLNSQPFAPANSSQKFFRLQAP